MSKISTADVKKVAKLANLSLSPEEKVLFQKQLSQILDYISQLQKVDTKNVEPTHHVTGMENVTRTDKVEPCLNQEQALSQAPATHNGFFKVPAIFPNE